MSKKWHNCGFCDKPIVNGDHTVGVPVKISPENLKLWKSAAGLREDETFSAKARFHIDHFEDKYRSVTSKVQPRVIIGAIPTLKIVFKSELTNISNISLLLMLESLPICFVSKQSEISRFIDHE